MPHPEGYLLRAFRNLPRKARNGIYAGKQVDVANRVSNEYEVRSRKLVKPNVQKVLLYSQALGRKIKLPVTTAALKAIDNAGGLDRYLLKTPDSLLNSDKASNLKFKLGCIYRYHEHKQQEQQVRQLKQQQQRLLRLQPGRQQQQQQQQLGSSTSSSSGGKSPLAAVQVVQRQQQALAAGGTSIRSFSSWSGSSSLLPPAAAAAVAGSV